MSLQLSSPSKTGLHLLLLSHLHLPKRFYHHQQRHRPAAFPRCSFLLPRPKIARLPQFPRLESTKTQADKVDEASTSLAMPSIFAFPSMGMGWTAREANEANDSGPSSLTQLGCDQGWRVPHAVCRPSWRPRQTSLGTRASPDGFAAADRGRK